jgi:hypothetical protein
VAVANRAVKTARFNGLLFSPGNGLSFLLTRRIARALATMAGAKAVSDFDAGFTRTYLDKAEAMLEFWQLNLLKNAAAMTSSS